MGSETQMRSYGESVVLVYEAAEQIATADIPRSRGCCGAWGANIQSSRGRLLLVDQSAQLVASPDRGDARTVKVGVRSAWGSETQIRSCGESVVLVDRSYHAATETRRSPITGTGARSTTEEWGRRRYVPRSTRPGDRSTDASD